MPGTFDLGPALCSKWMISDAISNLLNPSLRYLRLYNIRVYLLLMCILLEGIVLAHGMATL